MCDAPQWSGLSNAGAHRLETGNPFFHWGVRGKHLAKSAASPAAAAKRFERISNEKLRYGRVDIHRDTAGALTQFRQSRRQSERLTRHLSPGSIGLELT